MSQLSNNDKINEGASEAPQLCRTCFEFFGNKINDGLCSKCFREKCKTEQKVADLLNGSVSVPEKKTIIVEEPEQIETKVEEPEKTEMQIETEQEKPKPAEKESNRCFTCSKKVSLLGFKCKCGSTFCKTHRLPEDHDCEFDFKELGKARLAKENPNITASKMEKNLKRVFFSFLGESITSTPQH